MADNGFVEVISDSAYPAVVKLIAGLNDIEKSVSRINAMKITLPSQSKTASGDSSAVIDKINNSRKSSIDIIEKERLAELKLFQDRVKAFAKYEAQIQKRLQNEEKASKSADKERLAQIQLSKAREKAFDDYDKQNAAYAKLSNELNTLRTAAKNTAAEMYLLEEAGQKNSSEYVKLQDVYDKTAERVNKLDSGLKKIDSSLGEHRRNVGNYASAFDGLGNSLQQILREAPSAAVSLNTFFLAISNNLPQFFDEVQKINSELADLKATTEEAAAAQAAASSVQSAAASAAGEAENALSSQVSGIIEAVGASREQATAIREQVATHLSEVQSTGAATAATAANTESLLINSGATVEQIAALDAQILATATATAASAEATIALEAQTIATTEATAAAAAQPGILARIGSSLLSVNTALTLGVLVLTLWGGKIVDTLSKLIGFDSVLNDIIRTQRRLKDSINEAAKDYSKQEESLKSLQETAKNGDLDMESRTLAVQKLREQYAYYYKDLSDAQILSKEYSKSEEELLTALNKRTQALAKQGEVDNIKARITDINAEVKAREQLSIPIKKLQDELNELQKIDGYGIAQDKLRASLTQEDINANAKRRQEIAKQLLDLRKLQGQRTLYNDELGKTNEFQKSINESSTEELKKQADGLNNIVIPAQKEINKLQSESILLDYKQTDSKESQSEAAVDFLASQYELNRLRLENEASINEKIAADEETNYDRREQAANNYLVIQRQLAEDALAEQKRVLQAVRDQEVAALEQRVRDGEITEKNKNAVVYSLDRKFYFDGLTAYENYAEALRQIDNKRIESLKGVYDKINFQKATNLIDQRDVDNNQEYIKTLQDIVKGNKDYREIEKAAKKFQLENQDIAKSSINLEIEKTQKELSGLKDTEANVQRRLELSNQLIKKQQELSNITKEETLKQAAALQKLQQATEAYIAKFTGSSFFADLGLSSLEVFTKIEENGKTMFDNLYAGANTAGEKFAVVFNSVTEVAQQAFAFLQQNQQKYYDAQFANARKEYELNLKFAGDGAAAKEELDKQYEERQREIRIRQAKAAKETALFNAIVNTAQAVVGALPNYILAAAVSALGAVQIALIANQPIPAYALGTDNHPGGLARVGDGGRHEVIKYPGGKMAITPATDTLVNLPRGSQVYPDIASSGLLGSGLPSIPRDGNMDGVISALGQISGKLDGAASVNVTIDERGLQKYTSSARAKTDYHNNRVSFKGKVFR